MEHIELLRFAKNVQQNAYSPYSNFNVGAALLTRSGKVFVGCNVENASFGGTICAERVAVCNAVSSGETDFVAIAITSTCNDKTFPCGICLQFLSEFSTNITIVVCDKNDCIETYSLQELLPHQFIL